MQKSGYERVNRGQSFTVGGWRKVNTINDLRTDTYKIVNQNSRFLGQNESTGPTLKLEKSRSCGESLGAKKGTKKHASE